MPAELILVEAVGFACLECNRAWPRRPNTSAAVSGKRQSIICAVCHRTTRVVARITSAKCGNCGLVWSPVAKKMSERKWIRCRKCNIVFLPTASEMRKLQRAFVPEVGKYLQVAMEKVSGVTS